MNLTILTGDWIDQLRTLPDQSVQCCVTSPPYWGLRDYGVPGQLGLEKTPEEYVEKVVAGFRELRRVLRDDGTLWVNLGDTMWGGNKGNSGLLRPGDKQATNIGSMDTRRRDGGCLSPSRCSDHEVLKVKDMIGIPWRVAFALQADGWYLRSDIIWHKINPMPESVTDRPTKAHEYIFLLSKKERYFYDAEAVKEPANGGAHARKANGANSLMVLERAAGKEHSKPNPSRSHIPGVTPKSAAAGSGIKANESFHAAVCDLVPDRNKRTVWSVALAPYSEAHFATFPPDLIKPCIMAGTSARGCCPKCGAPWDRVIDVTYSNWMDGNSNGKHKGGEIPEERMTFASGKRCDKNTKTLGWQPTCECGETNTVPCTVLDPFFGSGTTGQVALELGRKCIGIELNPKYVELARQRCNITPGLQLA